MFPFKITHDFSDTSAIFQYLMRLSIYLVILIAATIYFLHVYLGVAVEHWHLFEVLLPLLFVPVSWFCMFFSRKGYTGLMLRLYLAINILGLIIAAWVFDGFASSGAVLFVWPIAIAGMLLRPVWSLYLAFLSLLVFVLFFILESSGWYQPVVEHPLVLQSINKTVFIVFPGFLSLAVLIRFTMQSIENMLLKIKEKNREIIQLSRVVTTTHDAVIMLDCDKKVTFVNEAFEQLVGKNSRQVVGKSCSLFFELEENMPEVQEKLESQGYWQGELSGHRADFSPWYAWSTLSEIRSDQGVEGYTFIMSDISRIKESESQLKTLAYYDTVTQLANRALFYIKTRETLARAERNGTAVAVLFIDLDRFKVVNDMLGHSAGDMLLHKVAQRMLHHVREMDVLARLGGDEFALLLESGEQLAQCAEKKARQLLDILEKPFYINGETITISASIGISFYPDNAVEAEELLKCADIAMYRAKKTGRNNVQLYEQELGQILEEKHKMNIRLLEAIENRQIELYYQPQYSLDKKTITGVEALARWNNGEGFVSPAEFIPVAEEYGLIGMLGEYILNLAISDAKQWLDKGFKVPVSVNLSPAQFNDVSLLDDIKTALEGCSFPANFLELEITESGLMENNEQIVAIIEQLKAMSIRLSMDDFGTGYSSLSYLKHFSIDKLKIDRAFVKDLESDMNDRQLSAAIVAMANSLDMEVIAEGVETDFQAQYLQGVGCDKIQGYWFSRPLPFDEFVALLQKTNMPA